jgi:dihydroorotase
LESFGALDKMEAFVSTFGRAFYKREITNSDVADKILLRKVEGGKIIEDKWVHREQEVVPFWSGKTIDWVIIR